MRPEHDLDHSASCANGTAPQVSLAADARRPSTARESLSCSNVKKVAAGFVTLPVEFHISVRGPVVEGIEACAVSLVRALLNESSAGR